MRRISATISLSLDGVMQAPGRPDEDVRGGFSLGGWAIPYSDEVMGKAMGAGMAETGAILLGRRTYQDFASFWPQQSDNPYTDVLNRTTKYVCSNTLSDPLPWQNSVVLAGDGGDTVAELKRQPGPDLALLGSGVLVRSLYRRGLIDRYVLLIHPLVIGSGTRLFADDIPAAKLRLVDRVDTTTGVIIATYEPA